MSVSKSFFVCVCTHKHTHTNIHAHTQLWRHTLPPQVLTLFEEYMEYVFVLGFLVCSL